jgi:hypothetical protein
MTIRGETMDKGAKQVMDEPGPRAGIRLTEPQRRARRARSIAIALALGAFVVVIFLVTIVKLGSNVLTRPM